MKKILFVSQGVCGGAERMTLLYAKILKNKGYDCKLLLHINKKKPEYTLLDYIPSDISYDIIKCRWRYLSFYLFRYLVKNRDFTCIFSSLIGINVILCILNKLHILKFNRLIIRDDNMPSRHSRKLRLLMRFFVKGADFIIAQTNEMKNEMLEIYRIDKSKCKVINNPIDKKQIEYSLLQREQTNCFDGNPNYISVGRVAPQKDYVTLIKAFKLVLAKQPNAKLYIYGKYAPTDLYKMKLDVLVKDLKLTNHVFFMGYTKNPYFHMNNADVFVLSSIYEGLPNVMLEALYLGLPVAATTCIPYISQIISDGVNGYTCNPENSNLLSDIMLKTSLLSKKEKGDDYNNSERLIWKLFDSL